MGYKQGENEEERVVVVGVTYRPLDLRAAARLLLTQVLARQQEQEGDSAQEDSDAA